MPITAATTPSATPAPAGHQQHHRRISSLRATTLNFFKGNNKGTPPNRRELTFGTSSIRSVPLIVEEEGSDVSPTELSRTTTTVPPTRAGADTFWEIQSYQGSRYHSTSTFEGIGRPRRDTLTGSTEPEEMNAALRGHSPMSRSGASEADQPPTNTDKHNMTSAGGMRTAAKLRMALSLLRRRSNPNLRKAYVEPVDENAERETWSGFNSEPLLDPDCVEPSRFSAPETTTPQRRGSTSKSNGFKFTLPVRGSSRAVLTKPKRTDQPRRATVASIVLDKETQANSVWGDIEVRPRSSQSTLPGEHLAVDDPSSIFSRESAALGGGAPSPTAGGLFPRPASLQRSRGEEPRKQAEVAATERKQATEGLGIGILPRVRQGSLDPDRVRPLSFGGVSNGYGSMRITEAAALEVRVNELEQQVSDLRGIIAESTNWPSRPLPFSEGVLRSSPTQSDTAVAPDESLHRFEQISPRGSIAARDRTLSTLEGFGLDAGNKRDTISTIRAPRRGSMRSVGESPGLVNMAEYAGVVSMIKREQKARKRLEHQVAALQEQMATVLHRQLVSQPSHSQSLLDTRFSSHLHRKASSEVPTPDITPPSSSAARQSANMFTSFDSNDAVSDEDEEEEDVGGSFYDGAGNQSEAWETPAQGKDVVQCMDADDTFGATLMVFPAPGGRTLSLSRLSLTRLTREGPVLAQRV